MCAQHSSYGNTQSSRPQSTESDLYSDEEEVVKSRQPAQKETENEFVMPIDVFRRPLVTYPPPVHKAAAKFKEMLKSAARMKHGMQVNNCNDWTNNWLIN